MAAFSPSEAFWEDLSMTYTLAEFATIAVPR